MAQTPRSSHGPGATPFDPSQGGETERAERRERSSSRSRAPAVTARQRPSDPALRAAADSIRAGMGASWRTHLGAAAPAARSSSRASLSAVSSPVTLDGSVEAAVVAAPLATSPVESPKYQRRARSPMAPRLSRSSHSNLGASPASRGLAAGDVGLATEIPVAASPPVTPASPASLPVSPRVSGATSRTHALQAASNRHHAARSIGGRAGHAPASPTLVKPGRPRHLSTLLRSRAVRRLVSLLIVVGIIVGIVHGADEGMGCGRAGGGRTEGRWKRRGARRRRAGLGVAGRGGKGRDCWVGGRVGGAILAAILSPAQSSPVHAPSPSASLCLTSPPTLPPAHRALSQWVCVARSVGARR